MSLDINQEHNSLSRLMFASIFRKGRPYAYRVHIGNIERDMEDSPISP